MKDQSQDFPSHLDDALVICYTPIDHRHQSTGNTRHIVGGELQRSAEYLAICRYPDDNGYYLLYCDQNRDVVTDTWHQSLDDAKSQAEFEYLGSMSTWISMKL